MIEPFATTAICEAVADRGRSVEDVDWSSVRLRFAHHDYVDLVFEWTAPVARTVVTLRYPVIV